MTQSAGSPVQSSTPTNKHLGNGLAVAGLVCGLIGLLFINYVLGPLAIIFGGVGLSRANRGAGHRGMSIAAIVLGILDLIVFAVVVVALSNN